MKENTIVRNNLMNREGYTPYCGSERCEYHYPRTEFKGSQFTCACGWVSGFPDDFISRYKTKWNLQ